VRASGKGGEAFRPLKICNRIGLQSQNPSQAKVFRQKNSEASFSGRGQRKKIRRCRSRRGGHKPPPKQSQYKNILEKKRVREEGLQEMKAEPCFSKRRPASDCKQKAGVKGVFLKKGREGSCHGRGLPEENGRRKKRQSEKRKRVTFLAFSKCASLRSAPGSRPPGGPPEKRRSSRYWEGGEQSLGPSPPEKGGREEDFLSNLSFEGVPLPGRDRFSEWKEKTVL